VKGVVERVDTARPALALWVGFDVGRRMFALRLPLHTPSPPGMDSEALGLGLCEGRSPGDWRVS